MCKDQNTCGIKDIQRIFRLIKVIDISRHFNNISVLILIAVSYINEGNGSTQQKPPTI